MYQNAGWLVVLRFNATLTAKVRPIMAVGDEQVFPGFLTPVLTQISFQSHQLLFSHVLAEVRGENTPERNFASIGSRTYQNALVAVKKLQNCNENVLQLSLL